MYSGFLIKIGGELLDLKYIKEKTYNSYPSVQDLDSYRDANGELHRSALPHVPVKTEFETMPLDNNELGDLLGLIRNHYLNELERKVSVTVFVPEYNDYVTQNAYMAEPKPKIDHIDGNKVYYESLRLAFIGY